MTQRQLLLASIIALTIVNIAALAFAGVWGLFALGASYPLAEKILKDIRQIDVYDLQRALSVGNLTEGSALQVEDLSATLKMVTFDDSNLRLHKALDKFKLLKKKRRKNVPKRNRKPKTSKRASKGSKHGKRKTK